jgi:predicted phosphodiesterase
MNKKIIAGFISVLCLFVYLRVVAQEDVTFDFVIEPYVQNVSDSSFSVLWETNKPARGMVFWGEAEINVLKPNLTEQVTENAAVNFHRLVVEGVTQGGVYFYKTVTINESYDTIVSSITPLNIPDYKRMPVSFAVIGDTQFEHKQEVWGPMSKLIMQEKPSFVIHVGDLVGYGPKKNDWVNEFFTPAKNLLRFYPLYPTLGNHEMDHESYYRFFDLPEPKWFYTVKKGNVRFVFVDTNRDILPGSYQYRKLEKVLATAKEDWKVMVHHHPVYVSEQGSYGNTWVQKATHGDPDVMHLKNLYEMYGIDLVLNGHIHVYERTWPIANNTVDTENGVTYITTGGGNTRGGKHPVNRAWYSAKVRDVNHFLNINIVENILYGQVIDTLGTVFDMWTMEKPETRKLNTPFITSGKQYFIDSAKVVIQNLNKTGHITYSIKKGEWIESEEKQVVFSISESASVEALVKHDSNTSLLAQKSFEKLPVIKSKKKGSKKIKAEYFEGDWIALPDFENEKIIKEFALDSLSLDYIKPRSEDHFAVRFNGIFEVPETTVYRLTLESFDGSRMFIDGQEVISNDGIHYEIRKEAFLALEKGTHEFELQYFDYLRRETLNISLGKADGGDMHSFNKYIVKFEDRR